MSTPQRPQPQGAGSDGVTRVALWSGPRSVSTALLYSFAQRADTRVVDEPLYAAYLAALPEVVHPGREEILQSQPTDPQRVVDEVVLGPCDRPVLFMKHMAHHLLSGVDRGFLDRTVNVILVRDPVEMLPSLSIQIPEPTVRDTGLDTQVELARDLAAAGRPAPVLDSSAVLRDPRARLGELCRYLGLELEESMFSWTAGARPEDGVWAPHWYHAVHKSTGFAPFRPKTDPFPERLRPLLERCLPLYRELLELAPELT
ncbi:MAG: sulfotransferase family protein [Acidobacteriota bacterium]